METPVSEPLSLQDRLLKLSLTVDLELLAYGAVLVVAVLTRFLDLGTRVMSHDESLHTYFSWKLAEEGNFQHSPLMHGPLQFHLIALSYFLFGASDASARLPAAIASVIGVALLIGFRRWLGRWGGVVAAALMTLSPYMLYYGRYVRNEALVVPIGLVMFLAVFRYFETRQPRWLYLLAASLALHFTAKETAFIYAAQLMVFLGLLLAVRLLRSKWNSQALSTLFMLGLGLILIAVLLGGTGIYLDSQQAPTLESGTVEPADPGAAVQPAMIGLNPALSAGLVLAIAGGLLAAVAALRAFGPRLRQEFPSLDALIIAGSVTLPQLAAFPAIILGWDPLAYEDPSARLGTGIVLAVLILIGAGIGLWWNWRRWLIAAGVFFGIFAFFYTTVLTYPDGLFTGLVGSLGYWLEQHGVNRGSQPLYYYLLVQVPIYEYLPAIGALLAGGYGLLAWRGERGRTPAPADPGASMRFPVLPFLGYWAVTSTVAYTIAGERMPWLTVHITLPYILLAGWAIGKLLQSFDWRRVLAERGWAVLLVGGLGVLALAQMIGAIASPNPPFAGAELDQLRRTSTFLVTTAVTIAAFIGLVLLARQWSWRQIGKLIAAAAFAMLFVLTGRTAFRAAFINYDRATEYMVYAHSATGVKTVLSQIEDLSRRTTDGMAIDVGYDDDVSWPFTWYMRSFSNNHYFANTPGRDLLNYPVIVAGDNNWAQVEPILGDRYHTFEYIRMWWPMQDYFNLTWERVLGAVRSPAYRAALWDIWFNRDYTAYGELTGANFSLEDWNPSDRMKLYIRKDIAALIWDYGLSPQSLEPVSFEDPYEDGRIQLQALSVVTQAAGPSGSLVGPRGMDVDQDGRLLVADSANHQIAVYAADGSPLNVWGTFGSDSGGSVAQFNEPWGVAAAPDGSVYVADTWNHRVQHLDSDGRPIEDFGLYGQGENLETFWGPRDVAVDEQGRVYVADTGNKRVVVFTADGAAYASFGGGGVGPGQLDEPVGLAIGPDGRVYVADTWNQRVQAFEEIEAGVFEPVASWSVAGWYGQSLNNKPYLAVSDQGNVCVTDPEGFRVLCFDKTGEFQLTWGDSGTGAGQFSMPVGLGFSGESLWVVDHGNMRLMRFEPPFE